MNKDCVFAHLRLLDEESSKALYLVVEIYKNSTSCIEYVFAHLRVKQLLQFKMILSGVCIL